MTREQAKHIIKIDQERGIIWAIYELEKMNINCSIYWNEMEKLFNDFDRSNTTARNKLYNSLNIWGLANEEN